MLIHTTTIFGTSCAADRAGLYPLSMRLYIAEFRRFPYFACYISITEVNVCYCLCPLKMLNCKNQLPPSSPSPLPLPSRSPLAPFGKKFVPLPTMENTPTTNPSITQNYGTNKKEYLSGYRRSNPYHRRPHRRRCRFNHDVTPHTRTWVPLISSSVQPSVLSVTSP